MLSAGLKAHAAERGQPLSRPVDAMQFASPYLKGYLDLKIGFPSEKRHSYGRMSRFWTAAAAESSPSCSVPSR